MNDLLQYLTPTVLMGLAAGLYQIARWLLEVRQDSRETKEHLQRLNGQVSDQGKTLQSHLTDDQMNLHKVRTDLEYMRGRLDERMGEKTP